jgi:hypothetical protein
MMQGLNVIFKGLRVNDVAEKVGSIFGSKGQEVGRKIDNLTKNVTIVFEDKKK